MRVAVVTGGSHGLGRALAKGLAAGGWAVVIDGRDPVALADAEAGGVVAVTGDVTDPAHRRELLRVAAGLGNVQLLVNNASTLGATPLPPLTSYPVDELARVFDTNVVAPLALIQEVAAGWEGTAHPKIMNITSDASIEAYEGWGGYGSSKAALDQLGAVLAVENPHWRVWTVDPGDMRTRMHQDAFPGEDISDRPEPETVVPVLLSLIDSERPSGRVRIRDLAEVLS